MAINFLHIILAMIIFMSSSGITINSHYCLDELKDIALFLPVKKCCENKKDQIEAFCSEDQTQITKKKCCNNKSSFAKAEFDAEQSIKKIPTLKPLLNLNALKVIPFAFASKCINFIAYRDKLRYYSFYPPPLKKPIYLLAEQFLC